MKSQNYNKIIKTLKTKGFKKVEIDPVLESKFILQRSGKNSENIYFLTTGCTRTYINT